MQDNGDRVNEDPAACGCVCAFESCTLLGAAVFISKQAFSLETLFSRVLVSVAHGLFNPNHLQFNWVYLLLGRARIPTFLFLFAEICT